MKIFISILLLPLLLCLSTNQCLGQCTYIVDEIYAMQYGSTERIFYDASCPKEDITKITWEPMTFLTCQPNGLCLNPLVRPIEDICYTVSVEWLDGTTSTDEFCIEVYGCREEVTSNQIISIEPELVVDLAKISLEVVDYQYGYIDILRNGNLIENAWEGWLSNGSNVEEIDLTDLPAGNYELLLRVYPEDELISFTKN